MAKTKDLEKVPSSVSDTNLDLYRLDMSTYSENDYIVDARKGTAEVRGELQSGDSAFSLLFVDKYRKDLGGRDPQNHLTLGTYMTLVETDDVELTKTAVCRFGIDLTLHLPQTRVITTAQIRRGLAIAYARTYVGSGATLTERVIDDLIYARIRNLYRA